MKTGGATKTTTAKTTVSKEKERKSLHPLQPAATDKENLVGAGRRLRSSTGGKPPVKNEMSKPKEETSKKSKDEIPKKVNGNTKSKTNTTKKVIEKAKTETSKVVIDVKKTYKHKAIQTEDEKCSKNKITAEDLTSEAGPSESYWKVLAERRRVALQDSLEENQILNEQLKVYKEMLDESRALVEVLQEMIGEDRNDINNSLDDSAV